jgi:hypothetical protein
MTEYNGYEFDVQVWSEDGVWNYSLIQSFRSSNSDEVEVLAYGTADSQAEAVKCVADELRGIEF